RKLVIEDDLHGLFELGTATDDPMSLSAPERIGGALLALGDEGEIAALPSGDSHRLRRGKRTDLDSTSIDGRDDAAVQPGIELELDALALDGDCAGRGR